MLRSRKAPNRSSAKVSVILLISPRICSLKSLFFPWMMSSIFGLDNHKSRSELALDLIRLYKVITPFSRESQISISGSPFFSSIVYVFIPRPLAFRLQFRPNPKQSQNEKTVIFRFIPQCREHSIRYCRIIPFEVRLCTKPESLMIPNVQLTIF